MIEFDAETYQYVIRNTSRPPALPGALFHFDARRKSAWIPLIAEEHARKLGPLPVIPQPKPMPVSNLYIPEGPKTPMPYQYTGVAWLATQTGAILADDMGLGKTAQALWAATTLLAYGTVEHVLIVCPKRLIKTWQDEVEALIPEYARAISICHYEALAHMVQPAQRGTWGKLALIVDEAHNMATETAQRTFFLVQIRMYVAVCWLLTGTPVRNRPQSCYMMYRLATGSCVTREAWDFIFWNKFRNEAKNLGLLSKIFQGLCLRRLKAEVTELPPPSRHAVYVELEGDQRKLYDAQRADLVAHLKTLSVQQIVFRPGDTLAKMTRLLQIAVHPGMVDPEMAGADDVAKLKLLRELVPQVVGNEQKVVVWSRHPFVLEAVARIFPDMQPATVHGQVKDKDAQRELDRFLKDKNCRLLCASIKAFGEGLNLQVAAHAFWMDAGWELDKFLQSGDRIHRVGQQKLVSFYYIIASKTLEEYQYETLWQKKDYQDFLTGKTTALSVSRAELIAALS